MARGRTGSRGVEQLPLEESWSLLVLAARRVRERWVVLSSSQAADSECSARFSAQSSRATAWICAAAASVSTVASGSSTLYRSENTSQPACMPTLDESSLSVQLG